MSEPISCPYCNKRNIAFITEYHKCVWAKSVQIFCALITILLLFGTRNNFDTMIGIGILGVSTYLGIQCYISYVESKTHIQCICKECGYVWIHDRLY